MVLDDHREEELDLAMRTSGMNRTQAVNAAIKALAFILNNRSRLHVRDDAGNFILVMFL